MSRSKSNDSLDFSLSELDVTAKSQNSFQGVFFGRQADDSEESDESDEIEFTQQGIDVPNLSESESDSDDDIMFEADEDDVDFEEFNATPHMGRKTARSTPSPISMFRPQSPPQIISRTLYIQMEFVERQTLQEVSSLVPMFLFSPHVDDVKLSGFKRVYQRTRRGASSSRS